MEIIRINNDKIKVSLSKDDMEFLEIDCDMLDGLDKKGRDAFNRIMDDAKLKYGFEVSGKRIFVQLFPSKDGGCEMFISRLYDKKRSKPSLAKSICYKFTSIDHLISFCYAVKHRDYSGSSRFYKNEQNKIYYICLEKEMPYASEFGGIRCAVNTDAYISEHCKMITDNAVEHLSRFI